MIAAFLFAGLLAATPPAEKPLHLEGLKGAPEFLAAATSLTNQKEFDAAQRVVDLGLQKFPAAQGFHLKQGHLHEARGKVAEAFYEYQWELLRSGNSETGVAAAQAIGAIMTSERRGLEIDEIHTVILAMSKLPLDGKGALRDLKRVEDGRGVRFVLSLLLAEAHVQARDLEPAARIYRSLIARDAYFVPAYVELAGVLRLQGLAKEADKFTARARELDPQHPSLQPAGLR
jgi:tetratricopeptide (TPR) repeat protein